VRTDFVSPPLGIPTTTVIGKKGGLVVPLEPPGGKIGLKIKVGKVIVPGDEVQDSEESDDEFFDAGTGVQKADESEDDDDNGESEDDKDNGESEDDEDEG
jgi:hypothetical protein